MKDDWVLSPDAMFEISGADVNKLLTEYRRTLTRLHSEEEILPEVAYSILKAYMVDYLKRV